jgi:integrase
MLAVANFSHLYCRNGRYYLRLTIKGKQVWISLKTDSLDIAVHLRSQVKPLISNALVISKLDAYQFSNFLLTVKERINTSLFELEGASFHKDMSLALHPTSILLNPPAHEITLQPKFSEVAQEFKAHSQASVKGLEGYDRYLELWLHLVEDQPIDRYTARDIGQAIDQCFRIPASSRAPYNRMSWKQRVECTVAKESDLLSRKSVGSIYKWVKSIFAYACADEIGYLEKNPCNIKRNFKPATRGYFTDAELILVQEKVMNSNKRWHKWITLIAMYHGMRRGEICQLRKEDIQRDPESNRLFFFVRSLGAEQNVKNANSVRKVPIHEKVLSLGFMDWIKEMDGYIFADVAAYSVTSWFSRFMSKHRVASKDEYGNIRTFHSFRHSFITKVRNAYPNLHHIQEVVGHKLQQGKTTDMYTHRIKQMTYRIAVVDSFTFTSPD